MSTISKTEFASLVSRVTLTATQSGHSFTPVVSGEILIDLLYAGATNRITPAIDTDFIETLFKRCEMADRYNQKLWQERMMTETFDLEEVV